jgi:hypothetical protein
LKETAYGELAVALKSRDTSIFIKNKAERDKSIGQAEKTIVELRNKVADIETATIEIPVSYPLVFYENSEKLPFAKTTALSHKPPKSYPEIDLILTGSIDEVEGYLIVQFRLISPYFSEPFFSDTLVMKDSSFSAGADDIAEVLAPVVAGTDLGSLTVTGIDDTYTVMVDDRLVGMGSGTYNYIPVGNRHLLLRSGKTTIEDDVAIEAGRTALFRPLIIEQKRRDVTLTSNPPGALVYLGSTWLGKTPSDFQIYDESLTLSIEAEGFHVLQAYLPDFEESTIHFDLSPSVFDYARRADDTRNMLYVALGFFLASIPVPIIFSGFHENEVQGSNLATSFAQKNEFLKRAEFYNLAYYGGLFLSAGLGVNMGFALADYILAIDKLK